MKAVGNYGEVLRSQRRLRLQARHCPRPQQALEQGRYPVRAADPLSAGERGCGDGHRTPTTTVAATSPSCSGRSAAGRAGAASCSSSCSSPRSPGSRYEIVANARANLQAQRITAGFGFLANNAGFDVSQSLIPYSGSDTYTRVFLVGLLNTLLVSVIGIFFATIIGFIVALGRLSPNWLLARVSGGYVELIRNLPVLFQILFWYLAVLAALPNPRQSISVFDSFFLSNRGLVIPKPIGTPGFEPFVGCAVGGDRGGDCAVALLPPATVPERQGDQGLALRARHDHRPAVGQRADLRRARHV